MDSNRNVLITGALLKELKETWKEAIGEGVETWQQFLKQPEIGLSVHKASSLIRLYDNLIDKTGRELNEFDWISYPNLMRLSQLPEVTDDLINQARTLSDRDFKEAVVENTTPDYTPTYSYMVMKKCNETGVIRKVHGITSEEIIQNLNINE